MAWEYNYTSRLYQQKVGSVFLSFNPRLDRSELQSHKGWSACQGIALDYVWSEGKWTCQERIEYDCDQKTYLVGTEKWKAVRDGMEFRRYQDLNVHLLRYEEEFITLKLPENIIQNISDLFRELKKKERFIN